MERLEAELRKRGVRFGTPANHVLKVSVTSITVATAAGENATVYISVEKADGWAKTYKGYHKFMSRDPEIARKISKMGQDLEPYAISYLPIEGHDPCMAVYFAVEEILNDPAFREALK